MTSPNLMNTQAFERAFAESGLEALVAVSLDNVYYTSGAFIFTQRFIPDRMAFNLIPRQGSPTMIVCNIEESLTREDSWIPDVRTYVEFATRPVALLAEVLREKGLERARIGIEKDFLPQAEAEVLQALLPNARFEAADMLFNRVRAVKSAGEIELLAGAARATERAILGALEAARPGDSEKKVADDMAARLVAAGADQASFCVLAAGRNTLRAHHGPLASRPFERGETGRVDFGGMFKGYYTDVARTFSIGKPSPAQADVWKRLRDIQRDTIVKKMRAGVPACDVYEHCKRAFEPFGVDFRLPHIGHSIGIRLHEYPMLHPYNRDELVPDLVMNVEPMVVKDGAAYHLEDLVLVRDGEPIILTDVSDTERLYVVD